MRIRQALGGFAAAAALSLCSIGSANALSVSVASTGDTLNGTGTSATYSGGAGGTLYVPSAPGTAGIPVIITYNSANSYNALFTFTPTSAVDGATAVPGGKYSTDFTGGTFDFTSANGTTTYLSGTYSAGLMTAAQGGTAVQFASGGANDVTYTGGTFLSLAGVSPGDIGAFGLSFSGADDGSGTGTSISGGYIDQFTSSGFSGTFSAFAPAAPAPEPGSTTVFATAALLLVGMLIVGRRRNSGMSIA